MISRAFFLELGSPSSLQLAPVIHHLHLDSVSQFESFIAAILHVIIKTLLIAFYKGFI